MFNGITANTLKHPQIFPWVLTNFHFRYLWNILKEACQEIFGCLVPSFLVLGILSLTLFCHIFLYKIYIYIQSMYSTFPYEKISNAQESQKNLGENILKFVINVLSRRRTVKSGPLQPHGVAKSPPQLSDWTTTCSVINILLYLFHHTFFHLSIYLSILFFDAK